MSQYDSYSHAYSDESFWKKVAGSVVAAGRGLLHKALTMYYATLSPETPVWAKTVIIGALGYFIMPVDAVPDVIPVVGFSDDLTVLTAAATAVAAQVKPEHSQRAEETLQQLFG